jgi:hypothetical protein
MSTPILSLPVCKSEVIAACFSKRCGCFFLDDPVRTVFLLRSHSAEQGTLCSTARRNRKHPIQMRADNFPSRSQKYLRKEVPLARCSQSGDFYISLSRARKLLHRKAGFGQSQIAKNHFLQLQTSPLGQYNCAVPLSFSAIADARVFQLVLGSRLRQ